MISGTCGYRACNVDKISSANFLLFIGVVACFYMFHLYGLFIGIAIVVGWSVAEKIEPKVKQVVPWVLGLGLVGARIWHVVEAWGYYGQNLWQVVEVWNGGLSIWGGLIGGGVGLLIGTRNQESGMRVEMLGAVVTALPLAQAIGRIGNGVNGEFVNKVWLLPWWASEAVLDLLLFSLIGRTRLPARRVWIYLIGYGLIRLVLQPYRM